MKTMTITINAMDTITMKEIREKYEGYELQVLDGAGFYWTEFMGVWSAVGEYGWNTTDKKIEDAEIDELVIYEKEKLVCIEVCDSL